MAFPIIRNPVLVPGLCIADGILSRGPHRIRFPDGKRFLQRLLPPQLHLPIPWAHSRGFMMFEIRWDGAAFFFRSVDFLVFAIGFDS